LTGAVALALIVVMVALAFVLPVPYVVEEPGPVFDTLGTVDNTSQQVVQISDAKTYASTGHIYLTTVEDFPGDCGQHPLLSTAIHAWFSSDESVIPVQAVCPPNQSSSEVIETDQADMAQSQIDAETAALTTLGYKIVGHEVVVAGVQPGSPAARYLKPEDVIISIDRHKISTPQDAISAVRDQPVGSGLAFVFSRDGKLLHATITSAAAPTSTGGTSTKTPYVGFTPSPQPLFNGITVKIGINPEDVGGPSAGTALALGIIDKLTPGGITGGRTIAGTGTISTSGKVGAIGGIQQKVAAAVDAGATVFFAPAANCADAKSQAPSSLVLIKATTLAEVAQSLKDINTGNDNFPHC
jgi:PDZ domain-containing protein